MFNSPFGSFHRRDGIVDAFGNDPRPVGIELRRGPIRAWVRDARDLDWVARYLEYARLGVLDLGYVRAPSSSE